MDPGSAISDRGLGIQTDTRYYLPQIHYMAMRVVDGQLFIGDEGRFIYHAGLFRRQPYYIPPSSSVIR